MFSNGADRLRNDQAFEQAAIGECQAPKADHAFWELEAGQGAAVSEGTAPNAGHRIMEGQAGQ